LFRLQSAQILLPSSFSNALIVCWFCAARSAAGAARRDILEFLDGLREERKGPVESSLKTWECCQGDFYAVMLALTSTDEFLIVQSKKPNNSGEALPAKVASDVGGLAGQKEQLSTSRFTYCILSTPLLPAPASEHG
jgi:hypothetical protein